MMARKSRFTCTNMKVNSSLAWEVLQPHITASTRSEGRGWMWCDDLWQMVWSQPQMQGTVPSPCARHAGATIGKSFYIIGSGDNKSDIYSSSLLFFLFWLDWISSTFTISEITDSEEVVLRFLLSTVCAWIQFHSIDLKVFASFCL